MSERDKTAAEHLADLTRERGSQKLRVKPDGTIREEEARSIEAELFRRAGRPLLVDRTHNVLADLTVRVVDPTAA